MSVTYGFYNSVNGDRKYNASQMSSIFEGIIADGVFSNIGEVLSVKRASDKSIRIASGRAWFNGTWTNNDSYLEINIEEADYVHDRIDLVVLEINKEESIRANIFKILKGEPSTNPREPSLIRNNLVNQYPLASILVRARSNGATNISQGDITSFIGTSRFPYITGLMQVTNIDNVKLQWESQWHEWMDSEKISFTQWIRELGNLTNSDSNLNLLDTVRKSNSYRRISLTKESWTNSYPYTISINMAGLKETDKIYILPDIRNNWSLSRIKNYKRAYSNIFAGDSFDGMLKIYATSKPKITFEVIIKGV